jgi:hypothetical protein
MVADQVFLNLTNPSFGYFRLEQMTFTDCQVQTSSALNTTLVCVANALTAQRIQIEWTGGWIYECGYLIRDYTDGSSSLQQIMFTNVDMLDWTEIKFADSWGPLLPIFFDNCLFLDPRPTFTHEGTLYSFATFTNCQNINPWGIMSTPFHDYQAISLVYTTWASATPRNYSVGDGIYDTYFVRDIAVMLTSSGGTGVNISLWSPNGTIIIWNLQTLTGQYLPIGFGIRFSYIIAPTVVVIGC